MSALNLLRAYRYPQLAAPRRRQVCTPEVFLDGQANTIYVVAAGARQEILRPVILALLAATYEAAVRRARRGGAARAAAVHADGRGGEHRAGPEPRLLAVAVRRPRHRDRDDLAVDRADRPALRASRARRDLRRLDRAGVHPAAGGADKRGYLQSCSARSWSPTQTARASARRRQWRSAKARPGAVAAGRCRAAGRSSSTATCRPAIVGRPDGSRTHASRATADCSSFTATHVACRSAGRSEAESNLDGRAGTPRASRPDERAEHDSWHSRTRERSRVRDRGRLTGPAGRSCRARGTACRADARP